MFFRFALCIFCLGLPYTTLAQFPGLIEAYLASATIYHEKDDSIALDLRFRKVGGPGVHKQHQMYVIAYMKKDEAKIFAMVSDPHHSDQSKDQPNLFLDVLLEKKLAVVLESKVAEQRDTRDPRDEKGNPVPHVAMHEGRSSLDYSSFLYEFKFSEKSLREAIEKLPSFEKVDLRAGSAGKASNDFKLLAFVPVNNCKYADKVEVGKGKGDFDEGVPQDSSIHHTEPGGAFDTPILLLKALPYDLHFYRWANDKRSVQIR